MSAMEAPVILHAERSFLICCKPAGMECEHDLPEQLSAFLKCKVESLYCVHRLDRAVGGVMVWARSAEAAAVLGRQIQEKRLKKEYFAVCSGALPSVCGEMHDLLFKDSFKQKSFTVNSPRRGVKEALLEYTVLETAPIHGVLSSLVRVRLHTGRFHQIRCQFASRGCPLLGDGKYGKLGKAPARTYQALYSYKLTFQFTTDAGCLSYLNGKTFTVDRVDFVQEYFS